MSGAAKERPGAPGKIPASGVKPIRPEEITGEKAKQIPDSVLKTFNTLIAQNFSSGSAIVLEKDIVAQLIERGINRSQIYVNHWLDVEDIYREAGWNVEYDKPGFNETYDASFTFRPSRKRA